MTDNFKEWIELEEGFGEFVGGLRKTATAATLGLGLMGMPSAATGEPPALPAAAQVETDYFKTALDARNNNFTSIKDEQTRELVQLGVQQIGKDSQEVYKGLAFFSKPSKPELAEAFKIIRLSYEMELVARSDRRSLMQHAAKHPDERMKTFAFQVVTGKVKPREGAGDIIVKGVGNEGFIFQLQDVDADVLQRLIK